MSEQSFVFRYRTTDEWNKIQKKIGEVEKEINNITIALCDELESTKIKELERRRGKLVREKSFLIRARKSEPIVAECPDVYEMLRKGEEEAYANGWPKDNN